MMAKSRSLWAAAAMAASLACSGEDVAKPQSSYAQGEMVYKNVCIACHNADPSLPGSVGPAIAGSSRELIEARVLRGEYPEGYQPKRSGKTMPHFPHLAGSIDGLAAYLARAGSGTTSRPAPMSPSTPGS